MLGKHLRKRGLTTTDISCYSYIHLSEKLYFLVILFLLYLAILILAAGYLLQSEVAIEDAIHLS